MVDVIWLVPLLLLPGVALLIMSTSVRYGQIHEETHHLLEFDTHVPPTFIDMLRMRARYFRNALVGLYTSVVSFVTGSIIGGVLDLWRIGADAVILTFSLLGIACVVFASVELVRESFLSLEVIDYHIDSIAVDDEKML